MSTTKDDVDHLSQMVWLSADVIDGQYQMVLLDEATGVFAVSDYEDHPGELELMYAACIVATRSNILMIITPGLTFYQATARFSLVICAAFYC